MDEKFVPLCMGEKPVGRIAIDLETGEFHGSVDPELAEILQYGFEGNLQQIVFAGKPAVPISDAQERFNNYLAKENS